MPVVTGLGLNVPLTLDGSPDTLSVTELLPPTGANMIVTVPLDFRDTVIEFGEDGTVDIEKSPAAGFTVTDNDVVRVRVPSVPLMVREYVPAARFVMDKAEVADPFAGTLTLAGLKVHVAPAGQLVTDRLTALLYPANEVAVIVELAALP